jgi:hypothetical protein
VKTVLSVAVAMFSLLAIWQLFKPYALPNALIYCVCAWILAKARKCL